jgi:hypothetical protein
MSDPFFTIAIPTKNRPDQLGDAITSVLDQRFADFEIVVCDNSDGAEAPRSTERVLGFDDARIRYVRTTGRLSMPDNWERAVAEARGAYVGVLTDRSVFRPDALEVIHAEIRRTDAPCVSWFNDLYGRDPSGTALKRRDCTLQRYQIESGRIIDYMLNGHPKYATKLVPKLMTAVCRRSVLDEIRASPIGRCCPPVAPDYGSGFLMLAHVDSVLMIDEALYVSCGMGTGSAFRRRSELGDRFRRDLGMSWEDMVDRMPSNASFSHALVLNDFMRLREALPERLGRFELNRVQYYAGCLNDYAKVAARGVLDRDGDLDTLLAALQHEPDDLRSNVEALSAYRRAVQYRTNRHVDLRTTIAERVKSASADAPLRFDSVFEAMRWDEANPRAPATESFIVTLPLVGDELAKLERRNATKRERGTEKRAAKPRKTAAQRGVSAVRMRLQLRTRLRRLARGVTRGT